MAKKRVCILGAGLAGLSVSWHLQRQGIPCQIYEKESEAGGLCRTRNVNGFTFDCSGHLLHFKSEYAFRLVKDLLGRNFVKHKRSAWIYSFGRVTHYPFQANLYGLPKSVVKDCLLEFIKVYFKREKIKKEVNFSEWIDITFGKGIGAYFMVPYNTKFWNYALDQITCEWVDGFIPIPNLSQIVEGTIKESRRNLGYNAFFWYPAKGGISELTQAFYRQISNIFMECNVVKINLKKKEITLKGGEKEKFDYLISSIPLPELVNLLTEVDKEVIAALKGLKWNSIFNLNLGIEKRNNNPYHWIYFPESDISFFRIGFPHNFSSSVSPVGRHSLYAEVSYPGDKSINENNIIDRIINDLIKADIISSKDKICVQDINNIKYGYPIYTNNLSVYRKKIMAYLKAFNVFCVGRYGQWKYMSMEDVILDGEKMAKTIFNK